MLCYNSAYGCVHWGTDKMESFLDCQGSSCPDYCQVGFRSINRVVKMKMGQLFLNYCKIWHEAPTMPCGGIPPHPAPLLSHVVESIL
jgi:hypothetical protein